MSKPDVNLYAAIQRDAAETVSDWLEKGGSPNGVFPYGNASGMTLLVAAVRCKAHRCVDTLLAHGADPNLSGTYSRTPLEQACTMVDKTAVRRLLKAGASASATRRDLGLDAAWYLLSKPNAPRVRITLLDLLVKHGAHLCDRHLHTAVGSKSVPLVHRVLKIGCDFGNPRELYQNALRSQKPEILNALFAHGLDPRLSVAPAPPPVIQATRRSDNALLRCLIDAGASVDEPLNNGKTALHFAAADANLPAVRLLIAAGADPNRADQQGDTPLKSLFAALCNGRISAHGGSALKVLRFLLHQGTDLEAAGGVSQLRESLSGRLSDQEILELLLLVKPL